MIGQLPTYIAGDITAYITTLNALPESGYTAAIRLAVARSYRNLAEACVGFTVIGWLLMLGLRKGNTNKGLASKQRIEKKEEKDVPMVTVVDDGGASSPS